jgi:hypothetical protein
LNILQGAIMGEIQIPFPTVSSAGSELVDPENDLVNYFLAIEMQPIAHVVERAFSNRVRKGYHASLLLSHILKVKQVVISDRVLVKRLKEAATYRRLYGFSDGKVLAHSTYHTFRKAVGPNNYTEIHAGFVRCENALNLFNPKLPILPKNRRKGLIVIADSTTIRAYCLNNGKKQSDGT